MGDCLEGHEGLTAYLVKTVGSRSLSKRRKTERADLQPVKGCAKEQGGVHPQDCPVLTGQKQIGETFPLISMAVSPEAVVGMFACLDPEQRK